jgi:hypothetical protein
LVSRLQEWDKALKKASAIIQQENRLYLEFQQKENIYGQK